MELRNTFRVAGSADDVFLVLLDMEQLSRCMPGTTLIGRDGDRHQGTLRLKVGPVTAAYEGTVEMIQADRILRRAILHAAGHEQNGQGTADATIVAEVLPRNGYSEVSVVTEIDISGRVAQFGRGFLADISQRVIDQFSQNLEAYLTSRSEEPATLPSSTHSVLTNTKEPLSANRSLDVLALMGRPILEKAPPYLIAVGVGLILGFVAGRRRR